ncbi:hypothetical protein Agub_g8023, partial [Astrephomene gubernaculifera]
MSSVAFAPLAPEPLTTTTTTSSFSAITLGGPTGHPDASASSSCGPGSSSSSSLVAPSPAGEAPFAVFARCCRAPRLLASRQREALLGQAAALAARRLGVRIVADSSSPAPCPSSLLEAVGRGERQAIGAAGEEPAGEWEVARLCSRYDAQPPLAPLMDPGMQSRCRPHTHPHPHIPASPNHPSTATAPGATAAAATAAAALSYSPGAHTVRRRLAVTRSWLLERDAVTYEVEERRPLGSVTALLRFPEEAGLLGLEWGDGAAPCLYMAGAARDEVLAALLDLSQAATGRPVPVLPGFTPPGDPIVGDAAAPAACHCSAVSRDAETERWAVEQLVARAKLVWPHLANSGRLFFAADIEFSPSPTPSFLAAPQPAPLPPPPGPNSPPTHQPTPNYQPSSGAATVRQQKPQQPPSLGNSVLQPHGDTAGVVAGGGGGGGTLGGSMYHPTADGSSRAASAVQEAADFMLDVVHDFNASVPYSGLPPAGGGATTRPLEGQQQVVLGSVLALLPAELVPGGQHLPCGGPARHMAPDEAKQSIAALQALQRLVSCHSMAEALLSLPPALGLGRLLAAYECAHEGVAAEAARLLTRLWAPAAARVGAAPWSSLRAAPSLAALLAADPDDPLSGCEPADLSLARAAKAACFTPANTTARCAALMRPLKGGTSSSANNTPGATSTATAKGTPRGSSSTTTSTTTTTTSPAGALLVACALEAITAVAVEPGNRSTDNRTLSGLLQEAASLGPPLFALCHHPAPRVTQGAALIMRAVAESGAAAAAPMRQAALRHGALLHHLHAALFAGPPSAPGAAGGGGGGGATAAHGSEAAAGRQQLGRALVASWCDEYAPALALLRRIFPPGLVRYLNAPRTSTAAAGAAVVFPPAGPTAAATGSGGSNTTGGTAGTVRQLAVPQLAPGSTSYTPGQQEQQQQQQHYQHQQQQPAASVMSPTSPAASAAAAAAATTATPPPPVSSAGATAAPASYAGSHSSGGGGGGGGISSGGGLKCNWEAFWDAVGRDHCHAGLIWHSGCRQELREALEREESGLRSRRQQLGGSSSTNSGANTNNSGSGSSCSGSSSRLVGWNYEEFGVVYGSLAQHTAVGSVYVRLLLEGADTAAVEKVPQPRDLFLALHQTFLSAADPSAQDPAAAAASAAAAAAVATTTGAAAAAEADQELCARAMAALYHVHAGAVGPVDGIAHLVRLYDNTLRRPLRHALLELLAALLAPKCLLTAAAAAGGGASVSSGTPASRAVRVNSYAFMDAGGLELLTDVVSYAHPGGMTLEGTGGGGGGGATAAAAAAWDQGGMTSGPAGRMLTATSHEDMPREWYFYPRGVLAAAAANAVTASLSPGDLLGDGTTENGTTTTPKRTTAAPIAELLDRTLDETGRAGPYSRDEIRQLVTRGSVHWGTLCWASGMPRPEPLGAVRELRWMLSKGPGRYSSYGAAELALELLQRLVALQPAEEVLLQPSSQEAAAAAVAAGGGGGGDGRLMLQLQPLPRAYRVLAGPRCLPHLAQVLLTCHPPLVSRGCRLLCALLAPHPAALARLHLTGALYFCLAQPGSDMREPAELLTM